MAMAVSGWFGTIIWFISKSCSYLVAPPPWRGSGKVDQVGLRSVIRPLSQHTPHVILNRCHHIVYQIKTVQVAG